MLYQTEMVQAILEDRKNQTRRTKGLEEVNKDWRPWKFVDFCSNPNNEKDKRTHAIFRCFVDTWFTVLCPYQIGDILWVRETWNNWPTPFSPFVYKATDLKSCGHTWKPSIHMPKKAARIFLKVISVKVERLQDISEEDAKNEGVKLLENGSYQCYFNSEIAQNYMYTRSPKKSFETLWQSINGINSWDLNPWVWIIEFEKIEKPEDFLV